MRAEEPCSFKKLFLGGFQKLQNTTTADSKYRGRRLSGGRTMSTGHRRMAGREWRES